MFAVVKRSAPVPDVMIREMHYKDGMLQLQLEHPVVMMFTNEAAKILKEFGGKNYLSLLMHSDELGDLEVVIRYIDGLTPAQRVLELEREVERLKAHCA